MYTSHCSQVLKVNKKVVGQSSLIWILEIDFVLETKLVYMQKKETSEVGFVLTL